MLSTKRKLLINLKNIPGRNIGRKIITFSADDYGNVRIASKQARENLKKAGLNVEANRFDQYDALENKDDLSNLFDTLTSVKDKNGHHAIFTAFAMPANIDFEAVRYSDYTKYKYELLSTTFNKLPGYEGVWDLWKEGMASRLLLPQFHGREHLNLNFFNKLLSARSPELIACIENNSFGGFTINPYKHISYSASYSFENINENDRYKEVIVDGLDAFEKVFGYRATHFMAPAAMSHRCLEKTLYDGGINYIDTSLVQNEYQGGGRYKKIINYQGKKNRYGQTYIIRNCVFEPSLNKAIDYVDLCLAEIEIAFKWKKPANISTHRVNFAGHIEPKIREYGLAELQRLLKAIVKRWPDVEFMASDELAALIAVPTDRNT